MWKERKKERKAKNKKEKVEWEKKEKKKERKAKNKKEKVGCEN